MDIHQFRDFINTYHADFVRRHYANVNGKNYWACICSAMDWLTEAGNALPEFKIRVEGTEAGWIDLYGYISCIDVIMEATEQLHRCIFERGGKSGTLMFKVKSIFTKPTEFSGLSDRDYFKELRAGFGAHPVNLHDSKTPSTKGHKAKRFACWVLSSARGQTMDEFDFSVMLYSNLRGIDDTRLGVKLTELDEFCRQYQKHLEAIVTEIKRQYSLFAEECRKSPIEISDDPTVQWKILTREANDRAPGMCDPDISVIFSVHPIHTKNRRLLLTYQTTVCSLMRKMLVVFPKMNDQSLRALYEKAHRIMYPPYPRVKGLPYSIGKLLENTLPYSVLKSEIETFFGNQIDFSSLHSDMERRVLIQAALFSLSKKRPPKPRPTASSTISAHALPSKRRSSKGKL